MTTIFQSKILPVVSSKDRPFLKRLFEHAHVMHQNDKRLHVGVGLSMIRSKQGACCFTVECHRRIWKSFCDHCSLCLKLSTSDSLGKYRHQLSDPRLASLLPVQSPVWHTVSIDILNILKQYRGVRGRLSTYKTYGLYFCDLATGLADIIMMDASKQEDVFRAIGTFANRHWVHATLVMDSGPQLKTLQDNPIYQAASSMGVRISPVAAYHQFLNYCERSIQSYKSLMTTMKASINLSIYQQSDTLIELLDKHGMVFRMMSMRPILTKTKDSQETVLLACQFSDPSMGSQEAEILMHGLLLGQDSVQGQLHAAILDYRSSVLSAFHQSLLTYLQEHAVYYANPKNTHTNASSNLDPMVGDFVAYLDGSKCTHFGIINGIMANNVVSLRVIKYGKIVWQNTQTRTCRLLFCPQDELNHTNI